MGSNFQRNLKRYYKRFNRWLHSEDFMQFIYKAIAIFVIFLMIFSGLVVLLK